MNHMIIIRNHDKHNEIYNRSSTAIRYNATLISSSCMCCSYMLRVCGCVFCLFLFCLYICVRVYLQIKGPLRECRSIRPGASRLPYYCTPLVCVPEVIGLLAVWRHNKPRTKKPKDRTLAAREWRSRTLITTNFSFAGLLLFLCN